MASLVAATPEELGRVLRELREARGVSLEAIVQKTKISPHTLHALEGGAFAQLPPPVFTRMFLRQYLGLLREDPTTYLTTFDVLWNKWEKASQPHPVVPVEAVKPQAWRRWLWGALLVVMALALLFWTQQREKANGSLAQPTPRALLATLAPTPIPTAEAPAQRPAEQASTPALVVESRGRACWVEWREEGQAPVRRLLPAGVSWQLEVRGEEGELLLGDAGAVNVRFGEQSFVPAGGDGQVVRLRLRRPASSSMERP